MTPVERRYTKDEFARRGDEIYEAEIAPRLKPNDKGQFLAIDIETRDFELATDQLAACDRLRTRVPEAQIWLVRVGYSWVHRL